MKKLRFSRLTTTFVALFLRTIATAQDYTTKVTGEYTITSIKINDTPAIPLPNKGLSGSIHTSKIDNSHINLKLTLNVNGKITETTDKTLLIPAGGNLFRIKNGNDETGTISPTSVSLKGLKNDGVRLEVKAVTSRSKEPASLTDYTTNLVGVYTVTSFKENNTTIPMPTPQVSAQIQVTKVDNRHVSMHLITVVNGKSQSKEPTTIELSPSSGGVFLMKNETGNVGLISATEFFMKSLEKTGQIFEIKASK